MMADLLSVTTGPVGFLSSGIQVTQSLVNFYLLYRQQDTRIPRTIKKLDSLLSVLDSLKQQLSNQSSQQKLLNTMKGSIHNCEESITELQSACHKFERISSGGVRSGVSMTARRVAYPFRQSTLQMIEENIDEIISSLSVSLQVLQQTNLSIIERDVKDVRELVRLMQTNQISSSIKQWLQAPDATMDYNDAHKKRYPKTGLWLFHRPEFSAWLTDRNSFLWIFGFAGSGKSVLCSTAIQYAFQRRQSNICIGVGFFYFSFNDLSKQNASAMLRALILQLSGQIDGNYQVLSQLHDTYRHSTPSDQALLGCLHTLVQLFEGVYLFLDALDEVSKGTQRDDLLAAMDQIREWNVDGLHLLATSRDEPGLCENLNVLPNECIAIRNESMDADIADFITAHLSNNPRMRNWQKYHALIKEKLIQGADGVFRWVQCQFTTLEKCVSLANLNKSLKSLPQSLEKTYDRMLRNIDEEHAEEAHRILAMLCCAKRPLTVQEIIEGIAIELEEKARFNPDKRLINQDDIHELCPGFIDVHFPTDNGQPIVRIAHFSVQEYLLSERIGMTDEAYFQVNMSRAHADMASICLAYLLQPSLEIPESKEDYPLLDYAAQYWHAHYWDTYDTVKSINAQVLQLFGDEAAFEAWLMLWRIDDPVSPSNPFYLDLTAQIASPLYYASLLGLHDVVADLLNNTVERDSSFRDAINEIGGKYGTALQAASSKSHLHVVQMLLQNGAEVNMQAGFYATALQAACSASGGNSEMVILSLLDQGAQVNLLGGEFGTALQAASSMGHEKVVRILLDKGADVNIIGGHFHTALQAASWGGHLAIMQILVNNGAEVNLEGGAYGTALRAASSEGHDEAVAMLLSWEAHVNGQAGLRSTAMQAAAARGHEKVVRMLLDAGADVDLQTKIDGSPLQAATGGGFERIIEMLLANNANVNATSAIYGSSLQIASGHGYDKLVRLLLNKGADINAVAGKYGTALQAASFFDRDRIVELLIDKGADIDISSGRYGTALQAASIHANEKIVRLLLDKGADPNVQGGRFGTALHAASLGGHGGIMRMLLDNGADANTRGQLYETALQAAAVIGYTEGVHMLLDKGADITAEALTGAAREGHDGIVEMLLQNGFDIDAQSKTNGTALLTASLGGFENVVQMLLDKGASVNPQCEDYGSPLQAAACIGHERIVHILLNHGAAVNLQGGFYGNPLQAAANGGYQQVTKMLLDQGAYIDALGGKLGTALQAASAGGYKMVVEILLERGADVDKQGGFYGNALCAASYLGRSSIAKMLLDKGADINAWGTYGTPLYSASKRGHKRVVRLLLENGADVNTVGELDETALQVAMRNGRRDIANLLLKYGAKNVEGV